MARAEPARRAGRRGDADDGAAPGGDARRRPAPTLQASTIDERASCGDASARRSATPAGSEFAPKRLDCRRRPRADASAPRRAMGRDVARRDGRVRDFRDAARGGHARAPDARVTPADIGVDADFYARRRPRRAIPARPVSRSSTSPTTPGAARRGAIRRADVMHRDRRDTRASQPRTRLTQQERHAQIAGAAAPRRHRAHRHAGQAHVRRDDGDRAPRSRRARGKRRAPAHLWRRRQPLADRRARHRRARAARTRPSAARIARPRQQRWSRPATRVMIDCGSTTSLFAAALAARNLHLTVVTNCLPVATRRWAEPALPRDPVPRRLRGARRRRLRPGDGRIHPPLQGEQGIHRRRRNHAPTA